MTDRIEAAAQFLARQHAEGARYQNLSGELLPDDIAEAYRVQARFQALMAQGPRGPLAGRKIALSSKPMQEFCGVDHPIAGGVFRNEIHASPATIRRDAFLRMGLEFELSFTFGAELGPRDRPYSEAEVLDAVASCQPAFELIEDRAADYTGLEVRSMIADNAWCGGVVLGKPIADWRGRDLNALPCTLRYNDETPERAVTGLADPVGSLVWVVNHVAGMGEAMKTGDVVITGSVIKTRYPEAGDRATYEIDGLSEVRLAVI